MWIGEIVEHSSAWPQVHRGRSLSKPANALSVMSILVIIFAATCVAKLTDGLELRYFGVPGGSRHQLCDRSSSWAASYKKVVVTSPLGADKVDETRP